MASMTMTFMIRHESYQADDVDEVSDIHDQLENIRLQLVELKSWNQMNRGYNRRGYQPVYLHREGQRNRAKGTRCFRCRRIGHISTRCPENDRSSPLSQVESDN